MARLPLSHDPLTGEACWFDYDEHTNEVRIVNTQDTSKVVDLAHEIAADESQTAAGIKNDLWRYAKIPNIVQLEMLQKHGVNIFERQDHKKMFRLLNTEYKHLKTTYKNHEPR